MRNLTTSLVKISVLIVTYNHEKFIAKAIDSVLMQKATFPYEIVIGDDCSIDQTQNILQEYKHKYPKRIRLLLQESNRGLRENYFQTLGACRGEYIAELDGDDYWTSANKLQVMSDFLDVHPDCPMCFSNILVVHEHSNFPDINMCDAGSKTFWSLADLLIRSPAQTSGAMTRRNIALKALDFPEIALDDKARAVLAARYGDVGYIDEVMSIWRIHRGGSFSRGRIPSPENRYRTCLAHLEFYEVMDEYFCYQNHDVISKALTWWHFKIAKSYASMRHPKQFSSHIYKGFACAKHPGEKWSINTITRSLKQSFIVIRSWKAGVQGPRELI